MEQKARMFNDLIGVPWEYRKMDCEILTKEVFKRLGVEVSDDSFAQQAIEQYDIKKVSQIIEQGLKRWEEINEPENPCLIALSLGASGFINHVGVYIGDGKFIHTTRMRGAVTIERIDNPMYRNRKFYRFNSNRSD